MCGSRGAEAPRPRQIARANGLVREDNTVMNRCLRCALVIVASLAAVEPALAQNRREMQMMADIRMLQEQTQQLQQQLQTAITTLTDALKTINGRIDEQANAT